ncbi:MAG: hypothetical protein QOH24_925 [Verrucomicrobiota bacterium]|jgi:hypothetical protein
MIADLKFGLRMLAKTPGFALLASSALAIGIGANSAIFTVINIVLLGFRRRSSRSRVTFELKKINPRFT